MFLLVYYFILGVLALFLQSVLPYAVPFLAGWTISSLVVLVVVCATIDLADIRALFLACGLGVWVDLNVDHLLGISVVSFLFLVFLILSRADPKAEIAVPRSVGFQMLATLVGTSIFLTFDYLSHLLEALLRLPWNEWFWKWPFSVWRTIALASLSNSVMSWLLFPVMRLLPQTLGFLADPPAQRPFKEHRPYVR